MRFVDCKTPVARHPTVSTDWIEPGQAYGNTETFTITTMFPGQHPARGARRQQRRGPARHHDQDRRSADRSRVAAGRARRDRVKGPTLMLGYIGIPLDETLDADGFFRTGDGGYLDDDGPAVLGGQAQRHHQDRRRQCLAARGRRGAVRASRRQGCPDRRRAARHARRGGRRLRRAARRRERPKPTTSVTFLRERLASYKVPRHVLFFADDDITLTGSAKIKSGELRELAVKRLAKLSAKQ